jgi:hypothetical protein
MNWSLAVEIAWAFFCFGAGCVLVLMIGAALRDGIVWVQDWLAWWRAVEVKQVTSEVMRGGWFTSKPVERVRPVRRPVEQPESWTDTTGSDPWSLVDG